LAFHSSLLRPSTSTGSRSAERGWEQAIAGGITIIGLIANERAGAAGVVGWVAELGAVTGGSVNHNVVKAAKRDMGLSDSIYSWSRLGMV
jgi:hypothetical protein